MQCSAVQCGAAGSADDYEEAVRAAGEAARTIERVRRQEQVVREEEPFEAHETVPAPPSPLQRVPESPPVDWDSK